MRITREKNMKIVEITMEGGVIQGITCPEGVKVVVRDYDCEGVEAELLKQDENGDNYIETVWE
jgi:hypothetical protein